MAGGVGRLYWRRRCGAACSEPSLGQAGTQLTAPSWTEQPHSCSPLPLGKSWMQPSGQSWALPPPQDPFVLCASAKAIARRNHHPKARYTPADQPQEGEKTPECPSTYLDLPLAHDLVHDFIVVLVELGLVVTFLIAEDAQGLGAFQFNLKLLGRGERMAQNQHSSQLQSLGWKVSMVFSPHPTAYSHLIPLRLCCVPENPGLGFADKIAEGIHLQCAVQVWGKRQG